MLKQLFNTRWEFSKSLGPFGKKSPSFIPKLKAGYVDKSIWRGNLIRLTQPCINQRNRQCPKPCWEHRARMGRSG